MVLSSKPVYLTGFEPFRQLVLRKDCRIQPPMPESKRSRNAYTWSGHGNCAGDSAASPPVHSAALRSCHAARFVPFLTWNNQEVRVIQFKGELNGIQRELEARGGAEAVDMAVHVVDLTLSL